MSGAYSLYIFSQICGYVNLLCILFLLSPQIYLNYQRTSTAGLSTVMILLWWIQAVITIAYCIASDQPTILIVSWIVLTISAVIILAQIVYYHSHPILTQLSIKYRRIIVFVAIIIAVLISLPIYFICLSLASSASSTVSLLLGTIIPALMIAASFLPQYYEYYSNESVEGFSLKLTAIDYVGCTSGLLSVLCSSAYKQEIPDIAAYIPFIIILAGQSGILIFACCMYPTQETIQLQVKLTGGYHITAADKRIKTTTTPPNKNENAIDINDQDDSNSSVNEMSSMRRVDLQDVATLKRSEEDASLIN